MTSKIFTKISRSFLALFIFLSAFLTVNAQTADRSNPSPLKFPTPKGIKNQLFYLQRDPNTNTIIYELNLNAKAEVNRAEPILVYWLRYDDNDEKKDLSYIQRKFAYGIQTKEIAKDQWEIRFVSHKKIPMYLMQSKEDQKYHVYVTVNNKKIELSKIFVRIEGGSFWLPNVKYVELTGINTATGTPVVERIKV